MRILSYILAQNQRLHVDTWSNWVRARGRTWSELLSSAPVVRLKTAPRIHPSECRDVGRAIRCESECRVRRWALGHMSQRFNSYFSAGAIKSEADAGFEKRGPDKNVLDVEGTDIRADTRRVGIAQFCS